MKSNLDVNVGLPRVFGFLPEPAGSLAFGGGAGGTAGPGVGWWYGGVGDASAGEPGGFVFKHPDVTVLTAPDVTANGASVDFEFAEELFDVGVTGPSNDGGDGFGEGIYDGFSGRSAHGHDVDGGYQ